MAQIEPGLVIAGRYRLEERLDAGGSAQVWRAADSELNRAVAVKILLTPPGSDASFLEAFRNEAQLEAALKHPSIVDVFDWGHDGEANYIVMELLTGESVRDVLQGGPVAWSRVLGAGRQLASALAYSHAAGVAHGAIEPEQVLLRPDGHATLIGFGLQCRGACEYAAMPDADTAGLGVLMYTMLTGASPSGDRPPNVPENHPWPEHPHKLVSDIPSELDRIVMKAISPDPAERYATAAELQADLDAFAAPKSRAWLWALLALLAVLIVGVGTWYFASQMKVTVPDVVTQSSAQASATLSSAGLKMVVTGQSPSADVPLGAVVAETPAAGAKVRRGSQVGVTLSTGKPTAAVPSVTGLDLQAASSQIASAGLVVGTVTKQPNSTFPANTVISQSPLAGQQLTSGSSVDLVVSSGQAQVTVPDVRGLSQTNATDKLAGVGLVTQAGSAYSSQPKGVVVTQGPAPGTLVPAGSTVTISISKGPAPVAVPNVVGATSSAAQTSLTNIGLVPVSSTATGTASQVGKVISQDPDAGTKVAPGSQVRIVIGK